LLLFSFSSNLRFRWSILPSIHGKILFFHSCYGKRAKCHPCALFFLGGLFFPPHRPPLLPREAFLDRVSTYFLFFFFYGLPDFFSAVTELWDMPRVQSFFLCFRLKCFRFFSNFCPLTRRHAVLRGFLFFCVEFFPPPLFAHSQSVFPRFTFCFLEFLSVRCLCPPFPPPQLLLTGPIQGLSRARLTFLLPSAPGRRVHYAPTVSVTSYKSSCTFHGCHYVYSVPPSRFHART